MGDSYTPDIGRHTQIATLKNEGVPSSEAQEPAFCSVELFVGKSASVM